MGSTTQRQIRLSECQRMILQNEDKPVSEIKNIVEKHLMRLGFGWHTRRDYLRCLSLI